MRSTTLGLLVVGLVALVGCSGPDDGPEPEGTAPTASQTPTEDPGVPTRSSFGVVTGRLPAEARPRLRERVTAVVDGWIDAAYVAGDYPRSDFADAFAGFTAEARRLAQRDRDLMSNAALGEQLDGVDAVTRQLRIDVLAVDRRAVGVTARVRLDLALTGQVQRRDRVAGELYLTWGGADGWQVFGYDMTRGGSGQQQGGRS